MAYVNEILEHLSDGEWHNLAELSRTLDVPFQQLNNVIQFLGKYGFVEIDKDLVNVKMKADFREIFMKELKKEAEIKRRQDKLITIKGQIKTIESNDSEIIITGTNLGIEEVSKEVKEGQGKQPMVGSNDLLDMLKFLMESSWYHYHEMVSKLQLTTEKLLEVVKLLNERK